MAFGDAMNDVEMLPWAGRGIAMARATSFSHLEYAGRGNIVSAWVDLP